jgi:hypothetical protein
VISGPRARTLERMETFGDREVHDFACSTCLPEETLIYSSSEVPVYRLCANHMAPPILLRLYTDPHLLIAFICSAYTVPIQVGTGEQNMSLQVDTGSSDLVSNFFQVPQSLNVNGHIAILVDRIVIMFE